MTTLREAAQQALEALEDHANQYPHMQKGYTVDAIAALRAALTQEQADHSEQHLDMVAEATVKDFLPVASIVPQKIEGERNHNHVSEHNMSDIEQAIRAKGLTAPRITPADIEAAIVSEHYFTAQDGRNGAMHAGAYAGREAPQHCDADLLPLGLLTFCVLVMRNGFVVTGESACASPENFDAEIGRAIARANAIQKIWPLLGYQLRTRLHEDDPGGSSR